MKNFKKIFSFVLVISFLFSNLSILSNAYTTENSDDKIYQYLIEKGIDEQYLHALPNQALKYLYNSISSTNDNVEVDFISYSQLKRDSQPETRGLINEENFDIIVGFFASYSPAGDYLTKLGILVVWKWTGGNPLVRLEDIVHIRWDSSIFSFDSSNYSHSDFRVSHSGEGTSYNETSHPALAKQGEFALYTDVYWGLAEERGGVCSFALIPKYTIYRGSSNNTSVQVEYHHDTRLPPLNIIGDVSIETGAGGNITISGLGSCDTMAVSKVFYYSR